MFSSIVLMFEAYQASFDGSGKMTLNHRLWESAFFSACLLEADSYAAASLFAHVVHLKVTKAFFLTGLRNWPMGAPSLKAGKTCSRLPEVASRTAFESPWVHEHLAGNRTWLITCFLSVFHLSTHGKRRSSNQRVSRMRDWFSFCLPGIRLAIS